MYIGDTYSDAGAEAIDDVDGNITDKIMVTGLINPDKPGLYTLTYNVKDNQGNEALSETREINVIDNVDPIITFNPVGNELYAKSRSTVVTVRDPNSGVKGSSLKYLWNTSTTGPSEASFSTPFANGGTISTPSGVSGDYYLWVFAQDNSGNTTIQRTNVFRLDNEKPIITINGNSNITISKGSTYTDAGANATDNIDATVTVATTGSVNPNIVGTYTITYNATDSSGNQATPVTRTINVIDIKAPVITITGSNPATVSGGGTYSDAGATALDDVDGDVTSKITTTSNVNTNVLGTYTVTYKVTDTAGNKATATRTVNVIDNILPTVTGVSVPTTWTSGNKTITVTGTDTGLSGIAGYYISTSSTKPTTGSAWTASTSTTWTVSRGLGMYYIWIKDGAGNISSTYKSIEVTNIDGNAPTVTAKGSSYTITEGASNVISSTYFNISANGSAPISSTTCIDTSKSNATVTNTSTLAVGTHVIKCTVTKATNLSANATTTIVVNLAEYTFNYTGSSQTFTAPMTGTYKLEVWGAQGGGPSGGLGGYSTGTISLNANASIYVYIGGQGSDGIGGYNGGGVGNTCTMWAYNKTYTDCGGGGGGTDIRLGGTALTNRIIIAGGGGGGGLNQDIDSSYGNTITTKPGGTGGGTSGGQGQPYITDNYVPGGTQTSGGKVNTGIGNQNGSLGQGGMSNCSQGSGGGGGYYGGAGGICYSYVNNGYGLAANIGGGGGSGYIGGVTNGSMQNGVRSGNGYAKITYIGQ